MQLCSTVVVLSVFQHHEGEESERDAVYLYSLLLIENMFKDYFTNPPADVEQIQLRFTQ